jgi:hypothetical protein
MAAMIIQGWILAGSLDPTNAPGPTMHSLEEIYNLLTNVNGRITTLPSVVTQTGQTNVFQAGDDGAYQAGRAWPNPRFSVGLDTALNCVLDNLTGLMWLKNPPATLYVWPDALTYCETLDGSNGRGGYTDWRLPNWNELRSLIDASNFSPALPSGHPFVGVQNANYWSSTTAASATGNAWLVDLNVGQISSGFKTITATTYVWPVRKP